MKKNTPYFLLFLVLVLLLILACVACEPMTKKQYEVTYVIYYSAHETDTATCILNSYELPYVYSEKGTNYISTCVSSTAPIKILKYSENQITPIK